jgi:Sugar kinases, ribokinase family
MALYNLACVGLVSYDEIIISNNRYDMLGGGVIYSSIQLSKFLEDPFFVSIAGNDIYQQLVQTLHSVGIRNFFIRTIGEKTIRFINKYIGRFRFQEILNYTPLKVDLSVFFDKRGFDMILLTPILNEINLDQLEIIKNSSKMIAIDVQGLCRKVKNGKVINDYNEIFKHYIEYFEILKAYSNEIFYLTRQNDFEKSINSILDKGCKIIIITLGEKGSLIFTPKNNLFINSYSPTKVVDPTGAGDVYLAAFTYYYLKTKDIKSSIKFASSAASYKVEGIGFNSLGTEEDIITRINDQKLEPYDIKFSEVKDLIAI